MKRYSFKTMAMLVIALLATGMVAGQTLAADKKYTIKLASEYPDKHPTVKNGFLPWIDEIKEKSGGRLKIQFFNPNTICPAKEAYSSLVAGAVDMVFTPTQMTARGKLPISSVALLPFMFNGAEGGSRTSWDLFNKYPQMQKEYDEVKVLWMWNSAVFELHTTKKIVKTLDDLKGMKIIVWTADLGRIVRALGANPVETIPHDTYLALQRGMAQGVMCPIAPMKVYKISDVAKNHTIVGAMTTHFMAAMNQKKWDSLPADSQQLLVDNTGLKMVNVSGQTLDQGAIKDAAWMRKKGHKFYVLPADEKGRWQAKIGDIKADWIKRMEGKGIAGAADIAADAYRLGGEYAQTTQGGYQ